jgi:hypothetical protein
MELGDAVDFFVDEDPDRVGKVFQGRRVLHPEDAPEGSRVFIGMPFPIAQGIRERMTSSRAGFHLPPPFPLDLAPESREAR